MVESVPEVPEIKPIPKIPEKKEHLLKTENLGTAKRALIVVTGWPEDENEWANSINENLDLFFAQANEETAVAQVYLGKWPWEMEELPEHLQHALEEAGNAEIDLIVFSAGVQALRGLSPDILKKIKSLTIVSPFLGSDVLRGRLQQWGASALGLPKAADFCAQLTPLIEYLRKEDKQVILSLGEQDRIIDSASVQKIFLEFFPLENFPNISISTEDRPHAPTPEQLLSLIQRQQDRIF